LYGGVFRGLAAPASLKLLNRARLVLVRIIFRGLAAPASLKQPDAHSNGGSHANSGVLRPRPH